MATQIREDTFRAVWRLQRMMYGPGLFRSTQEPVGECNDELLGDCILQSARVTESHRRPYCEPMIGRARDRLGRLFSREGISVRFVNGVPSWMETPWGEWWCWTNSGPGGLFLWASGKEEKEFLSRVTIDETRLWRYESGNAYAIRQVGDLLIPSFESCRRDFLSHEECLERNAEWITLCEAMDPKRYPHVAHYVDADLPIPVEHPDYAYAQARIAFERQSNVSGPWTAYARKHYPAP